MTTYVEIHALQSVPPSNINRDDTGAPKTATYGGCVRARVSSQSWKRAMREQFNRELDPRDIGLRTKQVVQLIMDAIVARDPGLANRAEELAVTALEAAKFKPAKKSKKDEGVAELTYLLFVSQQQIEAVAELLVAHADAADVKKAITEKDVKKLLDHKHSVDIALFGRMVADAPDLNVDAACQVAHALGVHEVVPEFDYYTAVDDVSAAAEEAGAGMIGTVEFYAPTLYRYAVVNADRLASNLGEADAARAALREFLKAFVESMPSGKRNTFANGTRPACILVTIGTGQPASLVGAFEEPVRSAEGILRPAVSAFSAHARDVFSTWRTPDHAFVVSLPQLAAELDGVGEACSFEVMLDKVVERAFGGVA